MPAKEPPQLNQTYQAYLDDPTSENYETLGEALMRFVEATIVRTHGSQFPELEDAVGEACLDVIKGLPSFNPAKSSFSTWVYNVTTNSCLDALRKRNGQQEEELDTDVLKSQSYDFYRNLDAKLDMNKLIAQLSKDEQELIEMKMHGFSNEEIAAELDTTLDGVKGQWKRLIPKLKAAKDPLGGTNEIN
jgi:RNA polymerase sigma factor (sigma-70 family)